MTLDVETFTGQVPYRDILPQGLDNLLVPVCLSSTHVAWGTIRLEPTWMNLCESAGHAAAMAVKDGVTPASLDPDTLLKKLATSHIMLSFFNDLDVSSDDPCVAAAQYFATKGFFAGYDARLDEPLTEEVKAVWERGINQLKLVKHDPASFLREVAVAERDPSTATDVDRGNYLMSSFDEIVPE